MQGRLGRKWAASDDLADETSRRERLLLTDEADKGVDLDELDDCDAERDNDCDAERFTDCDSERVTDDEAEAEVKLDGVRVGVRDGRVGDKDAHRVGKDGVGDKDGGTAKSGNSDDNFEQGESNGKKNGADPGPDNGSWKDSGGDKGNKPDGRAQSCETERVKGEREVLGSNRREQGVRLILLLAILLLPPAKRLPHAELGWCGRQKRR